MSSVTRSTCPATADLYQAGWSLARIAEKFGTTDDTVRARLLEVGVEMRPRQGGRLARS